MRTRAILLMLAAIVGSCDHAIVNRQAHVVPWIDRGPTPRFDVFATPPAGRPPRCAANDLSVSITTDGAAGNLATEIDFKNVSRRGCLISGRPAITILDAHGDMIPAEISAEPAQLGGVTPPGWPNVYLRPSDVGVVAALLGPWCTPRRPAHWTVRMPYTEGAFMPRETGTAGCATGKLSVESRPSLSVPPIQPQPLDQQEESYPLGVTIHAPSTAKAKAPLRFTVTLTNRSPTAFLFPFCLAYDESLAGTGTKAAGSYTLNCSDVGAIHPGASVSFAMELHDWFAAADGPAALSWVLEGTAGAHVAITVTGA